MAEIHQWEYLVRSFKAGLRGPKDEDIEASLDELGQEGWEVVSAFTPDNSSTVRVIAKRTLTRATRRHRTLPG